MIIGDNRWRNNICADENGRQGVIWTINGYCFQVNRGSQIWLGHIARKIEILQFEKISWQDWELAKSIHFWNFSFFQLIFSTELLGPKSSHTKIHILRSHKNGWILVNHNGHIVNYTVILTVIIILFLVVFIQNHGTVKIKIIGQWHRILLANQNAGLKSQHEIENLLKQGHELNQLILNW